MMRINVLGALSVERDGQAIALPSSRKTRALLGYLVLNGAPERRDRLCELFWELPDDPRGALRWSLSKLRPIVNGEGRLRLSADRERVRFEPDDVDVDLWNIAETVNHDGVSVGHLEKAWRETEPLLLEDCDLSNLPDFEAWLAQERECVGRLRARIAKRLTSHSDLGTADRVVWADRWLALLPLAREAALAALAARRELGRIAEADDLFELLQARFDEAGLAPLNEADSAASPVAALEVDAASVPPQKVKFIHAPDDTALAWASVGDPDHPPLVKAANWLSHIELDWQAPIWSPIFRELSRDFHLLRYDERGCGLSNWDVSDISLDSFVSDLELVVDAAGLERFPLLGISQGAAVSIEFAARHPERVSHLVLFGGYPAGWRHIAPPEEVREREAVMVLAGSGWGRSEPTYRRIFSQTFMPGATPEELDWFDEFQRRTTSADNAVRFLEAFSTIDVRDRLADIKAPTLVVHSRGDRRIPHMTGRQMAAAIPNAEFATLESDNHLLIGREPASSEFARLVRDFLKR